MKKTGPRSLPRYRRLVRNGRGQRIPLPEIVGIVLDTLRVYGSWANVDDMLVYRAITGIHDIRRTPERFGYNAILPVINGQARLLSRMKSMANRLLPSAPLPDLAYFSDGRLFNMDSSAIGIDDLISSGVDRGDMVVVKSDESVSGSGVSFVPLFSVMDRINRLRSGVVQRHLSNHPFFEATTEPQVVTIRITTLMENGHPRNASCFVRFLYPDGQGKLTSQPAMGVDCPSGQILGWGYSEAEGLIPQDDPRVAPFAGAALPRFDDLIAKAWDFHSLIPQFGLVGWDFCLDETGEIWLLEFNTGYPGIFFLELLGGPQLIGSRHHPLYVMDEEVNSHFSE